MASSKDPYAARIEIRLTIMEKRILEAKAKQASMTVSEWIRRRLLLTSTT